MKPPRDRSKLPKWAQQEIDRLERDLVSAYEKLSIGPQDSNTFADIYSSAPRPLGKSPNIDFVFGEKWSQKFQARLEGDTLRVSGGNSIAVFPQSSNVVSIKVLA